MTASDLAASSLLFLADFNGDGSDDILLERNRTHVVLLNDGTARFNATGCADTVEAQARAVADIDRDGRPDMIGWEHGSIFMIPDRLRQCASSIVSSYPDSATTIAPPKFFALVDMNMDGWLDLVTVNEEVSVALQSSAEPGTFLPATGQRYLGMVDAAVGDMDRDGFPDLVVANSDSVYWLRSSPTADGTFVPMERLFEVDPYANDVGDIALADLDDNGWLDIVLDVVLDDEVAVNFRSAMVFLQDGASDVKHVYAYHTVASGGPDRRHIVDLDGDGLLDLVVLGPGHGNQVVHGR